MAMYYYASKLNEASCSGCHVKVPPPPSEPAPPAPSDHDPLPPSSSLLGSGLSYYDNDDYYSLVRGNRLMSEATCKHVVMNGAINFAPGSNKTDGQSGKPGPAPDLTMDKDVEYKDGYIVSATLESLVDMMRPGASKPFMFTFLLCSRLYMKPHELLSKLCKRYFRNYDKIGKTECRELVEKELSDMVALVRILKYWTSTFPYDFRDERVMVLVRSITQRCAADHMATVRGDVSLTLERLLARLTALEHYEETLADTAAATSVDQLHPGDILSLGLTPVDLANQLTVVEHHRLAFVGPEEFVQTFAPAHLPQPTSSGARAAISLHHIDTKSTRNLEAYADWFNRLSYLVATDILKAAKSKYRARVIEQWVMTARECFNVGNFNSLMAIISALNMTPVSRLKKTWSRTSAVCGQQLRQLELCVEPSGNHARYRAALAAAPTDTAVPLLSVACRDLHFANQGTPSKLAGNKVNFEKCSLLARHVNATLASRALMSELAAPAPPRAPHPPVWRFLNDKPILGENALELVSFEREPPVDHLEKERLKRLRGAP